MPGTVVVLLVDLRPERLSGYAFLPSILCLFISVDRAGLSLSLPDHDHDPTIIKAADALSAQHPLAAVLALRVPKGPSRNRLAVR